jgi:hypothetical protein
MRTALTAAVLLIAAAPAPGDDTKPPALTDKEVADGWLLLFDGETTFGWKVDGDAKVKDGVLLLGGGQKETTATLTTRFASYELRMETAGGPGSVALHAADGGSLSAGLSSQASVVRMTVVGGGTGGSSVQNTTSVGPDGLARTDLQIATSGPADLRFVVPAGGTLSIKSVKLRPDPLRPIFNGKDLAGWKVFPGDKYKSKFEVTPAGELRVTNGPGDLQTEKRYANFVLQLECKTNGKALNSGVFFRCLPDQYQNGYEAQIQNAYKDNDRTKPADFGTGAIYRRVPARRVVSNDNEWFTMTVVADGAHLATWVNGYQTVDWTDDRPADDNPRKGSKTGAGHISIQGHDPTTDLLFRNIRIAELPEKK